MKKLILVLLGFSLMYASVSSSLFKTIRKQVAKKSSSIISKTIRHVDNSKYMKELIEKSKKIKVYTPVDKIAMSATLIAKKSGGVVADLTKKYPVRMVNYYSKYGDEFLKITNTLVPKVENIKIPKNLINKYNIKGNFDFLKNKEAIGERFLKVMRYTGKKGYEITKALFKYANKHKYKMAAGFAFAWFLANPEEFTQALNKFGGKIEEFLVTLVKSAGNTVANTVNGSVDAIVSSLGKMINLQNILFLIGIVLLFIIWKMRNLIGNYFRLKILKKENNEKIDSEKRSRYE